MSKKINTTSIGLFIVTGLALGVAGLLVFSSAKLFTKTHDYVAYFDESINHLNEGAPVKYRGVTIGSVKRVMARLNQATNDFAMPVILELQEKLMKRRLGEATEVFTDQAIERNIKAGMRVTLQMESIVTSMLYVDIRLDPKAPRPVYHQLKPLYRELPTQPAQIQQLMENLASIDLKSIETNLNALLVKLDTTVGQLPMAQISQNATNLLAAMNRLVSSPDLTNSLAAVAPTLDQYRQLGEKLNTRINPLADNLTNTLAEANRTLARFRGTAENLKSMLAPDSALRNNLDQALEQLAAASQSISALVEFLKQHPNALITGREIPKNQP